MRNVRSLALGSLALSCALIGCAAPAHYGVCREHSLQPAGASVEIMGRHNCALDGRTVTCIPGNHWEAASCGCVPDGDCTRNGCGDGDYCTGCWGHMACIPKGAF